jgi:hypothetical protein
MPEPETWRVGMMLWKDLGQKERTVQGIDETAI